MNLLTDPRAWLAVVGLSVVGIAVSVRGWMVDIDASSELERPCAG